MAQSFISELGDRLGGDGVANTNGEHVKTISAAYYKRNDSGTVSNPSLQSALDGKINKADACEILDASYYSPISQGAFIGQHAYCTASKTMYEWLGQDRGWYPIAGTHHRMIVQVKYIKVNGSTVSRNILCDKTDYTESSGVYQFKPIDPKLYAYWYNRGDSFELGHEVSSDPWGDGYPMWITEYQAAKDSNDNWYCTNLNAVRYNSGTLQGKWFNDITDSETGIIYLECQSW